MTNGTRHWVLIVSVAMLATRAFAPNIIYSTYLGGQEADIVRGIAVDADGYVYLTGATKATNFPTTAGAFQETKQDIVGQNDAFVCKLYPGGTGFVYSTYLSGTDGAYARAIAVDTAGCAYVIGDTESTNFPVTPGAFQTNIASVGPYDMFVAKLTADGTGVVYATYLGGDLWESSWGVGVDTVGCAYVTGYTDSTNFPVQSALQETNAGGQDVFVTKLTADGTGLVFSTYLGGTDHDRVHRLAVGEEGSVYVAGYTESTNYPTTIQAFQPTNAGADDVFLTKLPASGSPIVYSTYIGGDGNDDVFGLVVRTDGVTCLSGYTRSTNFPIVSGVQTSFAGDADVYVCGLSANGQQLLFSTYLGGVGFERAENMALDPAGSIYVGGYTESLDFPTAGWVFRATNSGSSDAFVAKLSAPGTSLVYSTYLGAEISEKAYAIGVDAFGSAYAAGEVHSTNFPVTDDAFQTNWPGTPSKPRAAAYLTRFPAFPADVSHTAISEAPEKMVLEWESVAGWTFNLEYSTNLHGSDWHGHPTHTNLAGIDGTIICTDTVSGARSRIYRLRAE